MKKSRLLVFLLILVLLFMVNNRNERIGNIDLYTINSLTHKVKNLIENLESPTPNYEYHRELIQQIHTTNTYVTLLDNLSFLDYYVEKYITDENHIGDFQKKDAMIYVKKLYRNLQWLQNKIDSKSKFFIRLNLHNLESGPIIEKNESLAAYYYLYFYKSTIHEKFQELNKTIN